MGRKDYQKGMVAGARPFEERFEQHAEMLRSIGNRLDTGINEISEVQEELIDISEEHEEKIECIDRKVNLGLDERQNLNILTENEKEILGGMMLDLSQKNSFSIKQKEFVGNVLRNLGLSHPQVVEVETIENVENIKVQKIIFRVLCELMFLEDNSFGFANDFFDCFSINRKNRDAIFDSIVMMHKATGNEGIVKKYCVSETVSRQQKKYPKLEMNLEVEEYDDDIGFTAELDMGDDFEVETETYRTESECKKVIDNIIRKYYNEEMRYILPNGDRSIGNAISSFYSNQVISIVNQILDFINIHNIKINVDSLSEMIVNIETDVREMLASKINSSSAYSVLDWNVYSDMIIIEEVEDFVETLFGGFKDVIRYQESDRGTNVLEIAEKMEQELNMFVNILKSEAFSYVLEKYVFRIKKVVEEINVKTGNA